MTPVRLPQTSMTGFTQFEAPESISGSGAWCDGYKIGLELDVEMPPGT